MADKRLRELGELIESGFHEAGLKHLRVRVRGKDIAIYSEYEGEKYNLCRFAHISGSTYLLEMANYSGRWEPTLYEGPIYELLDIVINQFGWVLQ